MNLQLPQYAHLSQSIAKVTLINPTLVLTNRLSTSSVLAVISAAEREVWSSHALIEFEVSRNVFHSSRLLSYRVPKSEKEVKDKDQLQ